MYWNRCANFRHTTDTFLTMCGLKFLPETNIAARSVNGIMAWLRHPTRDIFSSCITWNSMCMVAQILLRI